MEDVTRSMRRRYRKRREDEQGAGDGPARVVTT